MINSQHPDPHLKHANNDCKTCRDKLLPQSDCRDQLQSGNAQTGGDWEDFTRWMPLSRWTGIRLDGQL
jgi:hypothetical protein